MHFRRLPSLATFSKANAPPISYELLEFPS